MILSIGLLPHDWLIKFCTNTGHRSPNNEPGQSITKTHKWDYFLDGFGQFSQTHKVINNIWTCLRIKIRSGFIQISKNRWVCKMQDVECVVRRVESDRMCHTLHTHRRPVKKQHKGLSAVLFPIMPCHSEPLGICVGMSPRPLCRGSHTKRQCTGTSR